jgi:hypothetical protein
MAGFDLATYGRFSSGHRGPNSAGTGLRQQLRRPAHECLLLSGSDLPESGVFSSRGRAHSAVAVGVGLKLGHCPECWKNLEPCPVFLMLLEISVKLAAILGS